MAMYGTVYERGTATASYGCDVFVYRYESYNNPDYTPFIIHADACSTVRSPSSTAGRGRGNTNPAKGKHQARAPPAVLGA